MIAPAPTPPEPEMVTVPLPTPKVIATSLGTVLTFSSTSAWQTGTSTTAGAASIGQFQGGWAGSNIIPLTFASPYLAAGDYAIANIFDLPIPSLPARPASQSSATPEP